VDRNHHHHAVSRLIDALRTRPAIMPFAEIAAVRDGGHDLLLDATTDTVIAVLTPRRHPRLGRLTPREHEVVGLVATGCTNQQIARALSISVATVKDHVHSALAKTGFETRTQLIAAWYGGLPDRR
jgi:DNA-binding NarL/FixJ family response regulator